MEIVKAFTTNNLHTEIIIKGTFETPLFRATDIGEVLEINNIRSSIIHFDETEKIVQNMITQGGTQQVTFLTEKGLYKILFKSRKQIAEQFQNWVCDVIKEIRLSGTYKLKQELQQIKNEMDQTETKVKKEYDEKLLKEKALEKQNILLREFGTAGALVYILKVKSYATGEYVIKIGESRRGVEARFNEHKSKYEEALLLDCFMVNRSRDFEQYLHNHKDIRLNQVNNLQGHENENELFLIGKNLTYKMILNIIKTNIKQFNDIDYESLSKDIESIKNILSNQHQNEILQDKNKIQSLFENQTLLLQKITNLEKTNKEMLEKMNSMQTRTTTNFEQPLPTIGPRLQKINPETLQLIKTYETVSECMKEDSTIKRPSIHKAIVENMVYKGFRWMYVDREFDPNIVNNIKPTKQTKSQNLGYIAKLNTTKTQILNVYIDRKTAAIQNNYQSTSSLDNPVKNGTITNGHYYMLYENCENTLKQEFIEQHGEPLLYKDGVGQYDAQNNLVREFICKYDCIRTLCMSDKTLAKTLDKSIAYNGFYYKSIGSKIQCL
jgi:prophage antirepressor-like protein